MTEKEKCRLGLLYDANYDPEILADRERAKELLMIITVYVLSSRSGGRNF